MADGRSLLSSLVRTAVPMVARSLAVFRTLLQQPNRLNGKQNTTHSPHSISPELFHLSSISQARHEARPEESCGYEPTYRQEDVFQSNNIPSVLQFNTIPSITGWNQDHLFPTGSANSAPSETANETLPSLQDILAIADASGSDRRITRLRSGAITRKSHTDAALFGRDPDADWVTSDVRAAREKRSSGAGTRKVLESALEREESDADDFHEDRIEKVKKRRIYAPRPSVCKAKFMAQLWA